MPLDEAARLEFSMPDEGTEPSLILMGQQFAGRCTTCATPKNGGGG